MAVELLGLKFALRARLAPRGLGDAECRAVGRSVRLRAQALLLLACPSQVDDLAHRTSLGPSYFLRNASIETTLATSPPTFSGFSAFSALFAAASLVLLAGMLGLAAGIGTAVGSLFFTAASRTAGAGSAAMRGSSLNPNGTEGSLKPVIE